MREEVFLLFSLLHGRPSFARALARADVEPDGVLRLEAVTSWGRAATRSSPHRTR